MVSVSIAVNTQVEAGAPSLRLRTAQSAAAGRGTIGGADQRCRPGRTRAERTDFTRKPCQRVYGPLGNYLLGYDLPAAGLRKLLTAATPAGRDLPTQPTPRCSPARTACSTSTPIWVRCTGRKTENEPDELALHTENTQEHFVSFLQWLDADPAGLPEVYRAGLERALERFGVRASMRTPALESALMRLFRSFARSAS